MTEFKYPLARDTITRDDVEQLSCWLATNPRLTMGPLVREFQHAWSRWQGVDNSVFVNSGSSANLLALSALLESGRLSAGSRIVVPAVSWVTTVTPVLQLGMSPILCDCDSTNLGLDVTHFEEICKRQPPNAVILVHVLGVPNSMDEILEICRRHKILVIEDCCEALGSTYRGRKVGNFGLLSTFSFYYGHHASTIEGGMVCTNDEDLYQLCKSIRSHGWDRDLSDDKQTQLRREFDVDPFSALYTFYHAGFNLRSTELNAFLGLLQLERIDATIAQRKVVFQRYCELFADYWHMKNRAGSNSAFAFGLMARDREHVGRLLFENGIETRPLVCGSIGRQPFWIKRFGMVPLRNADRVHFNGLYLPCNQSMNVDDVDRIAQAIPNDLLLTREELSGVDLQCR